MVQERISIQLEDTPLQVTATVKDQFQSIAKWALILSSISFFVISAVSVAALLSMFQMGILRNAPGASPIFIGAGYLIVCILLLIPVMAFFQFSLNLRTALKEEDQSQMDLAFSRLRAGMRYSGLAILALVGFGVLGFFMI